MNHSCKCYGKPSTRMGKALMQATNPQIFGLTKECMLGNLYQRAVVRGVEFQLALFSLLVGFVVGHAPNFDVPTVRQKVSLVHWREWQRWFVGVFYAMFVQPVINAAFVGRSHQVPILAGEPLTTLPAAQPQLNTVRIKQAMGLNP